MVLILSISLNLKIVGLKKVLNDVKIAEMANQMKESGFYCSNNSSVTLHL